MQFSLVTFLAVFAASVAAAPAPLFMRDGTCDIATCVLDLAPSVVSCASAAAQLGADVFSDAGCLIAAAKDATAFPPSCAGCADQFGVTDAVASAENTVAGGLSTAGDAITGGLSSLGDDIKGLF
ncbi:hypothetical protein B0H10DRAFT_2214184 [Mycena sp. CBHHK59/15]|nr:hypothetical protein B0H10DRAFT_2223773 [Mycena sp. CBHHK59/15]KAJ6622536.1 hypothetical protein B0H10DRAFT_2214184 [Mycena sp. CBHHK59/15]